MRYVVLTAVLACSSASHEPKQIVATVPRDAVSIDGDDAPDDADRCTTWDPKNPACRSSYLACEHGWADCKCQDPPDVENPACWAVMPCPRVPDRRVRACRGQFPASVEPVLGRVLNSEEQNGATVITIGVGQAQGVSMAWKATLLRGESDDALVDGSIEIVRVAKHATLGKVHVPATTVQANQRVELTP